MPGLVPGIHVLASGHDAASVAELSIERLIAPAELAADAGEALHGGIVVAADIERARVGSGGLLLVLHALVGEAAAGPGLDALRIEQDRVVEVAGRRLEVVDREIAQAARDEGR